MNSKERAPRFLIDVDPDDIASLSTDDLIALANDPLLEFDEAVIALRTLRSRFPAINDAHYKLMEAVSAKRRLKLIQAPRPRVRLKKVN
jgi:hypothetical protein